MKRHSPTRKEKEHLTNLFKKGITAKKIAKDFAAWPQSEIDECRTRAESVKRAESIANSQRFAAPREVRVTSFETVRGGVGTGE